MGEQMNIGEICSRITVFAYKSMSVSEAARLMLEQHVGCLVVVDDTDQGRYVVGVLTDRDITVAVVAREFNAQTTRVAEVMSAKLVSCRPGDSIADVLALMRREGVRRIPVTDAQGALVGIVTLDDLIDIAAEQLRGFVHVIENERKREAKLRG